MAEESGQVSSGEAKPAAAPSGAEARAPETPYQAPAESEALKKKAEIFDQLNTRYKVDPKFQKVMDLALKGDYEAIQIMEEAKHEEKVAPTNDPHVKKILGDYDKLKSKLDQMETAQTFRDVAQARNSNSSDYFSAFDKVATKAGYRAGSEDYEIVFDLAEKEGKRLAAKYGLVNEYGAPDPNLKYDERFILEAFENANQRFKKIGYDAQDARRKELNLERQRRAKEKEDKFNQIINPEKLKTSKDRAKALERAFRQRMIELGDNLDNYNLNQR